MIIGFVGWALLLVLVILVLAVIGAVSLIRRAL
jgi:hypothetical protein